MCFGCGNSKIKLKISYSEENIKSRREKLMTFAQGAKTKIIDLKGKTLLPGFIDPHVHLLFSYFNHWVNLGPFVNENMSEVEQKLKEAVKK